MLQIKAAKTNIISWNGTGKVEMDNMEVEAVDKFTYLGSTLTTRDLTASELKIRLAIAISVTSDLSDVWKSKELSRERKKQVPCEEHCTLWVRGLDTEERRGEEDSSV